MAEQKPIRRRGRPPAGPGGQPRSAMRHQVTARIPDETYTQLKALAALFQISHAEVLTRALASLEASLTAAERKIVELIKERAGQ